MLYGIVDADIRRSFVDSVNLEHSLYVEGQRYGWTITGT